MAKVERIKKDKRNGSKLKPWREVVCAKMYEAALEEAQRKTRRNDPAFLYRWEHVCAVVNAALRLAELTGADRETVEAAAWLHDIAKDAGARHPIEGAAVARRLLPKTDFPAEKIEGVALAIELHMGLWRDTPLPTLEARVLWDADKLTKIGLTAALHWMAAGIAGGDAHTTLQIIDRLRRNTWRIKTVESMQTEPGRKTARERLAAFDRLYEGLAAEWEATDLVAPQNAAPARPPAPQRVARAMPDDD